jgi:hypothetical protein
MRATLAAVAAGLLIALLFCGGCTSKQIGSWLDQQAPDLAAKQPAPQTQPSPTTQPDIPANRVGQVAEVTLHVTQDPAVQAAASTVPFGPVALAALGGIALLVLGSAHKTQAANNTTTAALGALHGVVTTILPFLPAGMARMIGIGVATGTDLAATDNAATESGGPTPTAMAPPVAAKS